MKKPKIGILGGGQLGLLLLQKALELPIELSILDPNPTASVSKYCKNFQIGDFKDFQTVYDFGREQDIITFEIELVNLEALERLEKEGKKVFPSPKVLKLIQDKGRQRQFFSEQKIPGPAYELVQSPEQITFETPFVWKARQGGYDGKGVQIVHTIEEKNALPKTPALIEKMVDIEKEIAVLAARDSNGTVFTYPPCEMISHPTINLLIQLNSEITLTPTQQQTLQISTKKIAQSLEIQGVFAVEYFLDKNGQILLNEVSPRPHNSGHHTVYSESSSQNDQHLRAILGLPINQSKTLTKSILINIVKAKEEFNFDHKELIQISQDPQVTSNIIWYHKDKQTLGRKLGHIVLTGENSEKLNKIAEKLLKKIY